eukprot:1969480-Pleurochrysis_carterae.AAC.8
MADVALKSRSDDAFHTRSNSEAHLKVAVQIHYIHLPNTFLLTESRRAARTCGQCVRAQHQLHMRQRREQHAAPRAQVVHTQGARLIKVDAS